MVIGVRASVPVWILTRGWAVFWGALSLLGCEGQPIRPPPHAREVRVSFGGPRGAGIAGAIDLEASVRTPTHPEWALRTIFFRHDGSWTLEEVEEPCVTPGCHRVLAAGSIDATGLLVGFAP